MRDSRSFPKHVVRFLGPRHRLGQGRQEPGAFSLPSLVAGVGAAPFSGGTGFSPAILYTLRPQRSGGPSWSGWWRPCVSVSRRASSSLLPLSSLSLPLMTLKSLLFLLSPFSFYGNGSGRSSVCRGEMPSGCYEYLGEELSGED